MKNVLLSTAAWPNLHYLFYVANSDSIVVEQHETYPRQTFRNRYEVLSANGVLPLTIPVKRSGNHTKTKDILIDYSSEWQTRHWRALTSAYRKSPFFEFFEDDLKVFYHSKSDLLIDYNMGQLKFLLNALRLMKKISLSEGFEKTPTFSDDLRPITDPGYDFNNDAPAKEVLKNHYYQTFSEKFPFVPNLSCLDVLFNLGLRGKEYLTPGNQFKV